MFTYFAPCRGSRPIIDILHSLSGTTQLALTTPKCYSQNLSKRLIYENCIPVQNYLKKCKTTSNASRT